MYTPVNPSFTIQKWDLRGSTLYRRVSVMLKFYRLSGATFYDCINTIYQFIKPYLDNETSILEEYGACNENIFTQ